jgi:hypothetical protein
MLLQVGDRTSALQQTMGGFIWLTFPGGFAGSFIGGLLREFVMDNVPASLIVKQTPAEASQREAGAQA